MSLREEKNMGEQSEKRESRDGQNCALKTSPPFSAERVTELGWCMLITSCVQPHYFHQEMKRVDSLALDEPALRLVPLWHSFGRRRRHQRTAKGTLCRCCRRYAWRASAQSGEGEMLSGVLNIANGREKESLRGHTHRTSSPPPAPPSAEPGDSIFSPGPCSPEPVENRRRGLSERLPLLWTGELLLPSCERKKGMTMRTKTRVLKKNLAALASALKTHKEIECVCRRFPSVG